ncbi:hypothetical protein PR048_016729 [Dryococelus australis]|uniref:Uncharacterized protein n=1 Tax=Dryococelus australis TaxID=614101 RepID=A0ABQ9H7I6_9NEOP|nr:hypothetical protein PR048_016729 [Dryococelus australis]
MQHFFGPLKKAYHRGCDIFMKVNGQRIIRPDAFSALFNRANLHVATTAKSVSRFKATGIIPLDANIFRNENFSSEIAPGNLTTVPQASSPQPVETNIEKATMPTPPTNDTANSMSSRPRAGMGKKLERVVVVTSASPSLRGRVARHGTARHGSANVSWLPRECMFALRVTAGTIHIAIKPDAMSNDLEDGRGVTPAVDDSSFAEVRRTSSRVVKTYLDEVVCVREEESFGPPGLI